MMKIIDRRELVLYQPLIGELCAQENARGDNLSAQSLMQDLLQGAQTLVLIEKPAVGPVAPDTAPVPLMILLIQEVKDRVRPVRLLYINNFYMPSKDLFLAADLEDERAQFAALVKGYDQVLFQTRNAALVSFLGDLGFEPQMEGIIYSLTAPSTVLAPTVLASLGAK